MNVIQKIVKKINALPIRPDKMATIHAVDGNKVDILIDKSNIVIRSVDVIGGTDFIEPGDLLPISWVDGRPVIFSGTNETVTDLDIDGIVDDVISAVSFDTNSGGVTLDLFNSHRAEAAAHHSPVTVTNTGTVILTLLGQNLTASVDPDGLDFVRPTRQIIPGFGLSGGGSLAYDVTLAVDQAVLDHGAIMGLSDDDHTQYFNGERHTLAVHTGLGLVPATRQILSDATLSGGGNLTVDRTLAVVQSALDHGSISGLSDDDHLQYLRTDGTRILTGNLAVASGVTIDGVDISVHAANASAHHSPITIQDSSTIDFTLVGQLLSGSIIQGAIDHGTISGLSDDDHGQYFNATRHTLAVHTALGLVANTRQIISGNGLTGGGDFSADRTLAVGAGTGITVAADTVGINLTSNFTWAGSHIFQNTLTSRHILPELTDTYDLGSPTNLWRKGWLSELDSVVFSENTISAIGGWFMVTKAQGTLIANILSTTLQIDFGQTMTPNDFIIIRSSDTILSVPKTEYMQVGLIVSGTTYNVTRGVGGVSAKDWAAGTVYAVLGNDGDGRIEFQGGTTPRISMVLQGNTYNAQSEHVRIGDLNGMPGFSTETYGIFIGDATNHISFANGSLTISGIDGSSITNIDGGNITAGYISADRIAAGTITATHIATGAITADEILAGVITSTHISTNTIVTSAANITDAIITNAKIVSLDATKITTGYLSAERIDAGTITAAKLSATAIDGMLITGATVRTSSANPKVFMDSDGLFVSNASGVGTFGVSVVNAKSWAGHVIDIGDLVIGNATSYLKWDASAGSLLLAADGSGITSINGDNITTGAINASLITTGTLSASLITTGTLNATLLAAGSITSTHISTNNIITSAANITDAVITNAKIAALDATKITSGYISADRIEAGTIVGVKLSADAIDGKTITAAIIRTAAAGARTEMNYSNLFGLGFGGIGGTDGTTTQWYAKASDGKLYAGGGNVIVDSLGITIVPYLGYASLNTSLKWRSTYNTTHNAAKMEVYQADLDTRFSALKITSGSEGDTYGGIFLTAHSYNASPDQFYGLNIDGKAGITFRGGNSAGNVPVYVEGNLMVRDIYGYGSTGYVYVDRDVIGTRSAVTIAIGDGANVITNNSQIRIPVPFDMTLLYWYLNTTVTVTNLNCKLDYYNGTAWETLINCVNYSGSTFMGSLNNSLLKHGGSQKLLQFYVTAHGNAKEVSLTLVYQKTGTPI